MDKREQLDYINKWKRENQKALCIRLHKEKDKKLLEIYDSIPNKVEWFKKCLWQYAMSQK